MKLGGETDQRLIGVKKCTRCVRRGLAIPTNCPGSRDVRKQGKKNPVRKTTESFRKLRQAQSYPKRQAGIHVVFVLGGRLGGKTGRFSPMLGNRRFSICGVRDLPSCAGHAGSGCRELRSYSRKLAFFLSFSVLLLGLPKRPMRDIPRVGNDRRLPARNNAGV